jgi:hypothetical protein
MIYADHREMCQKRKENTPLEKHKRRWEDSTTIQLKKQIVMIWTGLKWIKIGASNGSFEHGNEPSVPHEVRNFLTS